MDHFKQVYREETAELLTELETTLLGLSECPDDPEAVGCIFRILHTIKGSGAMFGFDDVVAFTHETETVWDLVREEILPATRDLIDLTLSACDRIREMIGPEEAPAGATDGITDAFRSLIPPEHADSPTASDDETAGDASDLGTYRIRFRPDADIFRDGTNPILLLAELQEMGECRVNAHIHRIPPLGQMEPERCYLHWNIVLTTEKGIDAVRDVFIFAEDKCQLKVERINGLEAFNENGEYKRIGEILIDRGDITDNDLKRVLSEQRKTGEMLVACEAVDPDAVASALLEQQHMRDLGRRQQETVTTSSLRVAADKLDILVDLVGELVTVQASLGQRAYVLDDPELLAIAEEVERLTGELRDNTINIRMLPIGTTFARFRRLVHDLSGELGKDVVMVTEGGETELDKTVIERLGDPLVHIIRNSISHGIEAPEQREAAGKPVRGTIRLSAHHSGSHVVIRISDDGAGLDATAIREQALEKGLMGPGADLSEEELFSLIFAPGFSTAAEVDQVSGRGVGLDVVRENIEGLRGSIEIASQPGQSTTITLRLPLTLAIIDGLMVQVGQTTYVFPLSAVEECMELAEVAVRDRQRHIASLRGEIIPYIRLRELFRSEGEPPSGAQIVVVRLGSFRVGFVVDCIVGDHKTVIKSLGRVYKHAKGFSGSTILADGTVALILDPQRLVEIAEAEENSENLLSDHRLSEV